MMGTRATFGAVLTEMASENKNVTALTADFAKSSGLLKFKELYPERFLSVGIAEQNMIGIAAGIASQGRNVFASSFASFITTRCYEQIKVNLGYMEHNVKIVGIASGLGVSYQGNTHFSIEDVSLMRAIPNMTVVVPSDCTEVAKATEALVHYSGPAYLRLVGEGLTPILNPNDYSFQIGKGIIKRKGENITIIANGTMLSQALKASEYLAVNGIEATVINMHTVKPLDTELIMSECKDKKLIVSIEEGSIIGGLGSAIAEFISSQEGMPKLIRLGINDIFPHPGCYQFLLEQCGLTVDKIVEIIKANL